MYEHTKPDDWMQTLIYCDVALELFLGEFEYY